MTLGLSTIPPLPFTSSSVSSCIEEIIVISFLSFHFSNICFFLYIAILLLLFLTFVISVSLVYSFYLFLWFQYNLSGFVLVYRSVECCCNSCQDTDSNLCPKGYALILKQPYSTLVHLDSLNCHIRGEFDYNCA